MARAAAPKLLDGEKVILETRPHPVSFFGLHCIWIGFGLGSVLVLLFGHLAATYVNWEGIPALLRNLSVIPVLPWESMQQWISPVTSDPERYAFIGVWFWFCMLYGTAIGVLRISFVWLLILVLIGVLGALAALGLGSVGWVVVVMTAISVGVLLTELYRRAHRYMITDLRLLIMVKWMGLSERQVFFHRLSDLKMKQPFLGSLFDFGTLTPVSESGMGLGQDMAFVGAGVTGGKAGVGVMGGKTVAVARARSSDELFGIPEPRKVYDLMQQMIYQNDSVTHLKAIEQQIQSIQSASASGIKAEDK